MKFIIGENIFIGNDCIDLNIEDVTEELAE